MTKEKEFPPRGWIERERWLDVWHKCDPGDPLYNVGVHFIPHKKEQLPRLFEVISVAEHTAILSKSEDEQNEDFKNLNNANIGQYYEIAKLEKENERLSRRLTTLQLVHYGKNLKHYCNDWDFLEIDNTSPEFEACSCFDDFKQALAPPVSQEDTGDNKDKTPKQKSQEAYDAIQRTQELNRKVKEMGLGPESNKINPAAGTE